jgi:hypothetical protein
VPQVDLVGSIPGVELSGPFDVSATGGESVDVRLTDAVLHQRPDASALRLTATYDTATDRLVLERVFTPAVAFAGGQLELTS